MMSGACKLKGLTLLLWSPCRSGSCIQVCAPSVEARWGNRGLHQHGTMIVLAKEAHESLGLPPFRFCEAILCWNEVCGLVLLANRRKQAHLRAPCPCFRDRLKHFLSNLFQRLRMVRGQGQPVVSAILVLLLLGLPDLHAIVILTLLCSNWFRRLYDLLNLGLLGLWCLHLRWSLATLEVLVLFMHLGWLLLLFLHNTLKLLSEPFAALPVILAARSHDLVRDLPDWQFGWTLLP